MKQKYYRVIFFDNEKNKTVSILVVTKDINAAVKIITGEFPRLNTLSWSELSEDSLTNALFVTGA